MSTLPLLMFFRSLVLSVTNGANARSLTMAVEMVSGSRAAGGSITGLVLGSLGMNLLGNLVVKSVDFYIMLLFLVFMGSGSTKVVCGLGVTASVKVDVLTSVVITGTTKAVVPMVFGGYGISPTITSNPLVAALGSVVTMSVCCKLT